MEREPKINAIKFELKFDKGGSSVLIPSEGRDRAIMINILHQLRKKFEGKLQVATLYSGENVQIMFKKDYIPTEQEVEEAISALDISISLAE